MSIKYMKKALATSLLLFFAGGIWALEPCPENTSIQWDNCVGTYTWANGDKYVGGWQDKMHGQGTYTYADGLKFVGVWQDGRRLDGTYTWPNGDILETCPDDASNYQWDDYLQWDNCASEKKFGNEDVYFGGWQDGQKHGQGTFTWANGDLDNGKWRRDYKHGIFSHTRDGSTSDKNVFNMGEYIGRGDDSLKILETFCLAERDKEIRRTKYSYEILKDNKNYRLIAEQAAQDLKTSISNIEYDYENCIR